MKKVEVYLDEKSQYWLDIENTKPPQVPNF